MKILFSILVNAFILFFMAYIMGPNDIMWLWEGISVSGWWQTYMIWWIILWLINITIKPILKLLSLPLFFVFLWLVIFIINGIILKLFDYIIDILQIPWISYNINGTVNFIIAVAIFTILNMFYSLLPIK